MKLQRYLFFILIAAVAAQVLHYYPQMPEKMASHFDGRGVPNAWMPRDEFVLAYLFTFGLIAILFSVLPSVMRVIPKSMVNLPHKEYWLSPEHRDEAEQTIALYLNGAGNVMIVFLLCVFHLVFRANLTPGAGLGPGMWVVLVLFVVFMAGWTIAFIQAFRLPQGANER